MTLHCDFCYFKGEDCCCSNLTRAERLVIKLDELCKKQFEIADAKLKEPPLPEPPKETTLHRISLCHNDHCLRPRSAGNWCSQHAPVIE